MTDDPVAHVDACRTRLGPVRHRALSVLARRAAASDGEVRRQLLARLAVLLAQDDAAPVPVAPAVAPALQDLTALVDRLDRAHGGAPSRAAAPRSRTALPKPLKSVAAFQGTWSRLRVEQRLRQALAQVPAQAGPLNSAHIVSRALQTLHDLSPAYLDAFMGHVDALQWLEQASGAGDVVVRRAEPAAEPRRKSVARAPRKR